METAHPVRSEMNTRQAAAYIGYAARYLQAWRSKSKPQRGGPPFIPGRGKTSPVVYRREDLDAWVAERARLGIKKGPFGGWGDRGLRPSKAQIESLRPIPEKKAAHVTSAPVRTALVLGPNGWERKPV